MSSCIENSLNLQDCDPYNVSGLQIFKEAISKTNLCYFYFMCARMYMCMCVSVCVLASACFRLELHVQLQLPCQSIHHSCLSSWPRKNCIRLGCANEIKSKRKQKWSLVALALRFFFCRHKLKFEGVVDTQKYTVAGILEG